MSRENQSAGAIRQIQHTPTTDGDEVLAIWRKQRQGQAIAIEYAKKSSSKTLSSFISSYKRYAVPAVCYIARCVTRKEQQDRHTSRFKGTTIR
jgi:hypothetical protein